jgi:acid stress-induced BolA-like protein IbaG/YrbA
LSPAEVKALIQQGLPLATVEVSGEDHTHFEALVVCAEFEGKRPLARHQMVYATLGARMGREIHALSLRTLTPAEQARG